MKRHLFYTTVILATLNGLQAFNPLTAIRNVASGEGGCTASLIKKIEGGLPAYKQSDIQEVRKCIGNVPQDNYEKETSARNLASHHPNFITALSGLCQRNNQFRKNLNPQCNMAKKAASFIKNKGHGTSSLGDQANSGNQAGGRKKQRNNSRAHQQSHDGNGGHARHGNQMHHPNNQRNNNSHGYGNEQGCHCDCPEHHNNLQGSGYGVPPSPSNYGPTGPSNYGPAGNYYQGYGQPFPQVDQGYPPQQPQQPMPQQMQQQWPQQPQMQQPMPQQPQQWPQQPQCGYPQQPQYGY